jgi:hypothetical protein
MIEKILNYILNHLFEIITALIALYWAILSTFNYLKSKWWLKVDFHYHVLQRWFFRWKKDNSKMILSIVNIWNEIETISVIWFWLKNNKATYINLIDKMIFWKILILPKKINPSERITIQFIKKEVVKFIEENKYEPIYIWVWDTSWKLYKIKFNYNKIK